MFFQAIRQRDITLVRSLIGAKPELVHTVASAPPKKDDGQSPLQVAFKTGNLDIAHLLLDNGADVNFIEKSSVHEWRAPVLHDALRAAAFLAPKEGEEANKFHEAMVALKRLIELGANPNATDSYGNSALIRAFLDSRIRLSSSSMYPHGISDESLYQSLRQIFTVLIAAGADPLASEGRKQPATAYQHEPILAALLSSN